MRYDNCMCQTCTDESCGSHLCKELHCPDVCLAPVSDCLGAHVPCTPTKEEIEAL